MVPYFNEITNAHFFSSYPEKYVISNICIKSGIGTWYISFYKERNTFKKNHDNDI